MKIRDNKGSITMFVLVCLFFMSGFLLLSFGSNVNKSKIAKEQLDIMSNIYSHKDGDTNAYNRAYEALRSKNKKTISVTVNQKSELELQKTFEEKLVNYKIYGNASGLGTYDSSSGKYVIEIKVFNKKDATSATATYKVLLSDKLYANEYIDYINKKVVTESTTKESLDSLPDIVMCEDYTKIKITNGTSSKIVMEYWGYTI